MSLLSKLRRREVLKMSAIYVVGAWVVIQVADLVFPGWCIPGSAIRHVWIAVLLGLPVALVFSWYFDIGKAGIRRTMSAGNGVSNRTLIRTDLVLLSALSVVAIGITVFQALEILATRDCEPTNIGQNIFDPPDNSIAVLPFVNMSDDPSNEPFSDGIAEEIINVLTQVPDLVVISRSSAFSFKGQNVDIPTIAARLNVAHVLEGSVRKSGNQLRITAQLIEVESDTHLWSKTYDRELKNVFAIQDDIAVAVVDALETTLIGKIPKAKETSPEAYTSYLQARHLIKQRNSQNYDQAETLLRQVLSLDPGYAPAWTELAHFYLSPPFGGGGLSFDEMYERARHAIEQALAIDPEYGQAFGVLAKIEMDYEWNFAAADEYLERALQTNPNDTRLLVHAARLNRVLGRLDDAVKLGRRAVALDPVAPTNHYALGIYLYIANHPQEAIDHLRKVLMLSPDMSLVRFDLGMMLLAQGDVAAALVMVEQETLEGFRLTGRAIVQHVLGNDGESMAALQELLAKHEKLYAYQIASVYAFRNEAGEAFFWLERCYDIHDALSEMLVDPLLQNLHDDPRWDAFLDKMGLPR